MHLQLIIQEPTKPLQNIATCLGDSCLETDSSDDECSSLSSCASVIAPPFSPVVSDDNLTNSESIEDGLSDSCDSDQPLSTYLQGEEQEEELVEQSQAKETSEQPQSEVKSYKSGGDNLDLTVKARYMRMDGQKDQSLHYFHHMCVCDRINFDHLSIVNLDSCLNSTMKMALYLLPDKQLDDILTDHLTTSISRILATNIPFFSFAFSDIVEWHQEHEYYKEMSMKSEVVSDHANLCED